MFRHHYITCDFKLVFASNLLEHAKKHVARVSRSHERLPAIATAGDEMKIAQPIDAPESAGHRPAI